MFKVKKKVSHQCLFIKGKGKILTGFGIGKQQSNVDDDLRAISSLLLLW